MASFPTILKQLRRRDKITQDQLSAMLKISRSAVSMYESGKREPDFEILEAIADLFNVDMNYLLGKTSAEHSSSIPPGFAPMPELLEPYRPKSQMPLLGRVAAGLPMYAEENIEGYIANDFADGENYYALRVCGDSMNAAGIDAGDIVVVRQQSTVDEHEVGVILVNGNDATIKYFRQQGSMAILSPRSTNPAHQVQIYDIRETTVRIIGRVVQIRKNI